MKYIIFIITITLSGCGVIKIATSPYQTAGKIVATGVIAASPNQTPTYDYPYSK